MAAPARPVQRPVIVGVLLAVAALCWALLMTQWKGDGSAMSLTMGLPALPFLAMWVVMMVAMMFPSAAPMILTFHKVQASRRRSGGAIPLTCLFVAGYMLVWTGAGVVAYVAARAADAIGRGALPSPDASARIGGAILVAAGIYQLTALKDACLAKCRTPVAFIMSSWRGGADGALRMGGLHGAYCLGCCWLLFVVLFPLGIMNLSAMAALTLLICAEKLLSWGRHAVRAAAVALVVYGAVVVVAPRVLPTYTGGMAMEPASMNKNMP